MDLVDRDHRFPSARVFCNPDLLHLLQTSQFRPFTDSKTLVDLDLKLHPDEVLSLFTRLPSKPSHQEFNYFLNSAFILNHETQASKHVQPSIPADYTPELPSCLTSSATSQTTPLAPSLISFVSDLKSRWKVLCRVFTATHPFPTTPDTTTYSSLIPLPYPTFIPGGRFRECYYWDIFWIVKGLISSDMLLSAQFALRNLLFLVQTIGFVPNANRVYYLNRSHPPLLTHAVKLVFDALKSQSDRLAWLKEALPLLDKEYDWFTRTHSLQNLHPSHSVDELALSRYHVDTAYPRPESYSEDTASAASCEEKGYASSEALYKNLASAAESGWDFSSRWFARGGKDGILGMNICDIVPCCLNSILFKAEKTLSLFHAVLAEQYNECANDDKGSLAHLEQSRKYQLLANRREQSMIKLLWDLETGFWFDYDLNKKGQTGVVSAAGLMPVWAGCGLENWNIEDAKRFVNFVASSSGLLQPGGLACTNQESEEQWDFPNCWPPLVDLGVEALRNVENKFPGSGAREVAESIALRFLETTHAGWLQDGHVMHEKYDCRTLGGERGEGGEYLPQTGFGWTNGTVLWLLRDYCNAFNKKLMSQ